MYRCVAQHPSSRPKNSSQHSRRTTSLRCEGSLIHLTSHILPFSLQSPIRQTTLSGGFGSLKEIQLPQNTGSFVPSRSYGVAKTPVSVQKSKYPKHPIQNGKKHIVLIDGSQLIYRAYYAYMKLEAKGATYGYTKLLLRLLDELKPYDYIAVCMDHKSKMRKDLLPEYKATRPSLPETFKSQFKWIDQATIACNVPILKEVDCEADDVIASYAKKATAEGCKVTIVSLDKDLMQLVDDDVVMYDIVNQKFLETPHVVEKFGVQPHQVPQVQALIGDKADNIPSIVGVGPKTSSILMSEFGSIENLLSKVDSGEISATTHPKQWNAINVISENRASVKRNLQLVTLITDLPSDISQLGTRPRDREKLMAFLEEMRFPSIVTQIKKAEDAEIAQERALQALREGLNPESAEEKPKKKKKKTKAEKEAEANGTAVPEPEVEIPVKTEPVVPIEVAKSIDWENVKPAGVTLVRDRETAKRVVSQLLKLKDDYHACDTETTAMDFDKSAVGQGRVICASIYVGPQYDFGGGPRIWIDNLDECEGVLSEFKEYFQDEKIKKVWHNYAFDRHVLANEGIQVEGFGGDTMQMARLWDSSRMMMGGYSLGGLTQDLQLEVGAKISMKDRFSKPKLRKDGKPGKVRVMPHLDDLQRDPEYIHDWIHYSVFDAESTWHLRETLESNLKNIPWEDGFETSPKTQWDLYQKYWLPFGQLLVDIETEGIKLNMDHMREVESLAAADYLKAKATFLEWVCKYCPDAQYMNTDSDAQKQQLFFAPCTRKKITKKLKSVPEDDEEKKETAKDTKSRMEKSKEFETDNTDGFIEEGKTKAKKKRTFVLSGFGMKPVEWTDSGWPAVSTKVLKQLAGSDPHNGKYGDAFAFFKGKEGHNACVAIDALVEAGSIQTLLSSFISTLPEMTDNRNRIHTSLNVNTETGRLSSRRPNLQNQPALEKDKYKIRDAFTCEDGNALIVADYGQLELRLLAHVTACKSMIRAFKEGGDFHSRTAMGMYPEIMKEVEEGKVLLEWDHKKGKPPVPLIKDKYSGERRKAKVLNFSIAYGKTAHGLAKDWHVSLDEAKETLERWYRDRPEVREWQNKTIKMAEETGYTRTLLGRRRLLPHIADMNNRGLKNHSDRAAINTPLQGGAADIVICAMVKLYRNERLKELGWKQVLQIHDEVILEGPEESKVEALQLVKDVMRHPLDHDLLIDLDVDAKVAKTWFQAK